MKHIKTGALLLALMPSAWAAQQCAIPGELVRWQAAYCMFQAETDDIGSPRVQKCLDRESARQFISPCAGKQHYKEQICRISAPERVRQCVADKRMVPDVVENGV